jgi:hypothetical protein
LVYLAITGIISNNSYKVVARCKYQKEGEKEMMDVFTTEALSILGAELTKLVIRILNISIIQFPAYLKY